MPQLLSAVVGYLASTAASSVSDLDSYIEQAMASGKIGGMSITVVKNDEVLWNNAYGSTKPGDAQAPKVSNDTAFMFASLSKTNIGVAAMLLKERGLLKPEDDVNDYLSFSVRNPSYPDQAITIHQLLTHTSSISDSEYDNLAIYFAGDPGISLHDTVYGYLAADGQWAKKGKSYSKRHAPGKAFAYSNIGACLMAYICEVVAGREGLASDFDAFVRTHIHEPLGISLDQVGYFAKDFPSLQPGPYALPSQHSILGWRSCDTYAVMDYPTCDWRSSSLNYAKMLGMFINFGTYQGTQILKRETVEYMRQRSEISSGKEVCSNALWLYEKNLLTGYDWVLGHDGSDAGISTYAYFNPESGVGYVLLTNADMDGSGSVDATSIAIGSHLMSVFDASPPPAPPAPTPGPTPAPTTTTTTMAGCPGGSLRACIALCPAQPDAVYTACVQNCGEKCSGESPRRQRHARAKGGSPGPGSMSAPGCSDLSAETVV